jgi:hypothetical protein
VKEECSECGAELRLGPAHCPLCGTDNSVRRWARPVPDVEIYQDKVRTLREQLRRLREDAEAV